MKTYTIKQKLSGTGSIHDIASDMFDRDIKFPKGCCYAVVLSAYYGGKGYTAHKSISATIKQSKSMGNYSHSIIGLYGNRYDIDFNDNLVKI